MGEEAVTDALLETAPILLYPSMQILTLARFKDGTLLVNAPGSLLCCLTRSIIMMDRASSAAHASTSRHAYAEPFRLARSTPVYVLSRGRYNASCKFNCTIGLGRTYMSSRRRQTHTCQTYPTPETEKERSSVDYPQAKFIRLLCLIII